MNLETVIYGNSAVWLNLLAVTVISFVIANLAVSILSNLYNQKFLGIEVNARKQSLWLLASMPWLISAIIGLYFSYPIVTQLDAYTPFTNNVSQFNSGFSHWHHIDSFYLFSWHGITLIAAVALVLYQITKKLMILKQHVRQTKALTELAKQREPSVYELDTEEACAFSCGFRKPVCYITSGMLAQTNRQEQEIIYQTRNGAHCQPRSTQKMVV